MGIPCKDTMDVNSQILRRLYYFKYVIMVYSNGIRLVGNVKDVVHVFLWAELHQPDLSRYPCITPY